MRASTSRSRLVYGEEDWSRPSDRQADIESVPGARDIVLRDTGHFAALEAPDDWARILLGDVPLSGRPSQSSRPVLLLAQRGRCLAELVPSAGVPQLVAGFGR
jgi:hypothetical protein